MENLCLCEHGNYHCYICEIRLLKKVIEEYKTLVVEVDSLVSFLHHRGFINYGKKGCLEQEEVTKLIGTLRTLSGV